jgi:hypothetical protein
MGKKSTVRATVAQQTKRTGSKKRVRAGYVIAKQNISNNGR